jgi:hypothetical protein
VDLGVNSSGGSYVDIWTENLPDGSLYDKNFHPGCSDSMYAVDYNDYLGQQWAYEEVEDVSHSVYFSNNQQGSSYINLSGVSADWIVEGWWNDLGYPVADFGTVQFTNTLADRNGSSYNLGSLPHDYAVMCTQSIFGICGAGTTTLVNPGSISGSGTSFIDYWDASS